MKGYLEPLHPWVEANPALFVVGYLTIGFIIGSVLVKRGPPEECPACTLILATLFWGIAVVPVVVIGLLWTVFFLFDQFARKVLKVTPSNSDNHGV